MKYTNISGFSILVLCILHCQIYSSESLVVTQPKSQNKADDFLFARFGCSPALKTFPRDVQYLIVKKLKELIVGKIKFEESLSKNSAIAPLYKPTVQESVLKFGASLVNLVRTQHL